MVFKMPPWLYRKGDHPDYICPFCCGGVCLVRLALRILQQVQRRGEEMRSAIRVKVGHPRRGQVIAFRTFDRKTQYTKTTKVLPEVL